jgi:hypothetical protein
VNSRSVSSTSSSRHYRCGAEAFGLVPQKRTKHCTKRFTTRSPTISVCARSEDGRVGPSRAICTLHLSHTAPYFRSENPPSSTCHPCSASCPSKIRYQVKNGQDCPGGGRKISMPNIGPSIVPISPIKTVRARAMRPKLNCKAVAGPLGSV